MAITCKTSRFTRAFCHGRTGDARSTQVQGTGTDRHARANTDDADRPQDRRRGWTEAKPEVERSQRSCQTKTVDARADQAGVKRSVGGQLLVFVRLWRICVSERNDEDNRERADQPCLSLKDTDDGKEQGEQPQDSAHISSGRDMSRHTFKCRKCDFEL